MWTGLNWRGKYSVQFWALVNMLSILQAPREVKTRLFTVHAMKEHEGEGGEGSRGMAPLTFTCAFPLLVLFTYGHSKPLKQGYWRLSFS